MDSVLRLKLLGSPEVWLDDEPLTGFITVKSRALLFYLAMKPGVHGRHTLATLLWPEAAESNAAKNLRNALSNLRKLAGNHLEISRQTAAFRRESPYFLDVEQFSGLLARYKRGQADAADLETAVSLYAGDFLDGFHVPDTELYEEWLVAEREQLRQAQITALHTLAAWYADRQDYGASLGYVSRLLALDNLNEMGWRFKMTLLMQQGRRNEALAQYTTFCRLLNEALGVTPLAETTRLYEQIKAGEIGDVVLSLPKDWRLEIGDRPIANLQSPTPTQIDWGDIPGEVSFYGRHPQLRQLQQWLTDGQHRFIAITGIGGVGKTALAAKLARWLASSAAQRPSPPYEFIIWRSLINAPPFTAVLRDWLETLSGQQLAELPPTPHEQIALLLAYLRQRRCLLVLDNYESVMEVGVRAGRCQPGYEGYEQIIQRVGGGQHQSCLLITSRELPGKLSRLDKQSEQAGVLALPGLPDEPGSSMLRACGVAGNEAQLAELVRRYSGNPLALKLAADTAQTLFGGDIEMLLAETAVYGDIRDVLDEQFGRLTPLEDEILTWLAVEREPVSSRTIWDNLARQPHKRHFLEALRSLYFRSLLDHVTEPSRTEAGSAPHYALQNVVMEYATDRLVESVCREIEAGAINWLQRIALVKAHTKEYVQKSQRRLILEPVAQWLTHHLSLDGAIDALRYLLETARAKPPLRPGYAGANILHLLTALGIELDGWDFSHLAIRQADLRDVSLRDVSFRGSDLSSAVFRDTFSIVHTIAFSPDGHLLAAAAFDGSITLWRLHEYQPYLVIKRSAGYDLAIAFSPDGRHLAGGGSDNVIRLWDTASGRETSRLSGHTNQVTAVLFSPDGKILYSGSEDQTIGVWDVASERLLQQIPNPGNLSLALAISPDGQMLAGGGYDGVVYLWRPDSGTLIRCLQDELSEKIHSVAFSPDGGLLAAAGEDHAIHLWDVRAGRKRRSLTGHASFVLSVAFHPDGRTLVSGSADKTIRLWDVRQGRSTRVIRGGTNWVTSVAFRSDGAMIASGGYDRQIRLWQSQTGHLLHALQGTLRVINLVTFSPDGRLLAGASYDRPVLLWDAHTGKLQHSFQAHSSSVRSLAFSPDARILAVGGDENAVRLWHTETGQLQRTLTVKGNFARTLAFSPDGRLLAVGSGVGYGELSVWEVGTGRRRFTVPDARVGLEFNFCFSPDGQYLVYADRANALNFLDVGEETICCVLAGHQSSVEVIRFSPDGSLAASLDRDGTLFVWQLTADGSVLWQTQFQGNSANADYWNLVFSPDSQTIAFQLEGGQLGIFDARAGWLRCTVAEMLYGVGGLVFSRDSAFLITGSVDGRIRVWDAATGELHNVREGHEGMVRTLDANLANGRIASGGDDGIVRVWDIEAETCELTLAQLRPYEGLDITGATGLTPAQAVTLQALGAIITEN